MKYIKIPREIIYASNMGIDRVLVFSYLYIRKGLDDITGFSLEDIIKWMGSTPNATKGGINEKIISTLNSIAYTGYVRKIKLDKPKAYSSILLDNSKINSGDYGIITLGEIDRIINFKGELEDSDLTTSRISSSKLLLLLAYIRVNISHADGNPECCYRYHKKISHDIGISDQYILKLISILEYLKMIKHKEPKHKTFIGDSGQNIVITAPKVFANYFRYVKGENGELVVPHLCMAGNTEHLYEKNIKIT
jgi:hypothetical protein